MKGRCIWRGKLRSLLPIGQPVKAGDLFAAIVDDIPLHHASRRAKVLSDQGIKLPVVKKRWMSFVLEVGRYHPVCEPKVSKGRGMTIDTMLTVPGDRCVKCDTLFLTVRGVMCERCRYRVPHPGIRKKVVEAVDGMDREDGGDPGPDVGGGTLLLDHRQTDRGQSKRGSRKGTQERSGTQASGDRRGRSRDAAAPGGEQDGDDSKSQDITRSVTHPAET